MLFEENLCGRSLKRQVPGLPAFTGAQLVQLLGTINVHNMKIIYIQIDKCVQNPYTVPGRYRQGAANEQMQSTYRQAPLVFAFFAGVA